MQGKLLAPCGLGVPSVFRIQRRGMNRRPLWQVQSRRTCPLTFKLMCSPLVSSFVSAMALKSELSVGCENKPKKWTAASESIGRSMPISSSFSDRRPVSSTHDGRDASPPVPLRMAAPGDHFGMGPPMAGKLEDAANMAAACEFLDLAGGTGGHGVAHGSRGRGRYSDRPAAAAQPNVPAPVADALRLPGLHAQLEAIVALFTPTAEELEARSRVIVCVTDVVRGIGARLFHVGRAMPGNANRRRRAGAAGANAGERRHRDVGFPFANVEVYGSARHGLALYSSDLDLRLKPALLLKRVLVLLAESPLFHNVSLLKNAR